MSKRKAQEVCGHLGKLAKLHATPVELLQLCAEFTETLPFQNQVVRTVDVPYSKLGLSVDGLTGEYFVSANDEIHVFSPTGEWLRKWPLNDPFPRVKLQCCEEYYMYPHAVCVADGTVYVANRSDNCVHLYTTQGIPIRRWHMEGKIDGLAVHHGQVYVCDILYHCIKIYDETNGTLVRSIGTQGTEQGQFHFLLRSW